MRLVRGEAGSRSGMSTLEVVLAMALFAVIGVKAAMVLTSANDTQRSDSANMALEDQARRVLDQIAYAVMGSDRDSLFPDPSSPIFSTSLRYQISLGVENGQVVWDDPEEIGLSVDEAQVLYRRNPDAADELRVAWCNVVRPFLEGEVQNGDDDNGNGIVDEKGLSFVVDGSAVTIRLSVERPSADGEVITKSVNTTVTVRN
jgi:type II secretory pathway pseudopilin PulG